ncbi:lecithin retinol acyltransferase family protein [Paraburkholderia fungorum]|uniref:lecithin retinol acyltransferase family protein n=1 Tax=Paraburkholderia fungorum TaxID=134537 RepID=UPI00402BA957
MVHAVLEDILHPEGRVISVSGANQSGRGYLKPGDHIAARRHGYWHHGIYVGDGRVVHYAGFSTSLRGGPVQEISLDEFALGGELVVVNQSLPKYLAGEIVKRAHSRLGESRYSVFANNCEHFCTWCVTGQSQSMQVRLCMSHPLTLARLLLNLLRARMLAGANGDVNPPAYA